MSIFKTIFLALIVIYLSSCSSSNNDTKVIEEKTSFALAVGGNFSDPTGLVYSLRADPAITLDKVSFNGSSVNTYQDSIVRAYSGKYFIFSRDSNSAVLVFDSKKMSDGPIANYSLAETDPNGELHIDGGFNGTNPYEIAFENESSAFVVFYNSNYILHINPLTGERLDKIDIGFGKTLPNIVASDANTPNAVSVIIVENRLFILLQRLNSSFVALTSAILIYDVSSKSFVDTNEATTEIDGIILSGKNPASMKYVASNKSLYIAHNGSIIYTEDFSAIIETEAGTAGIEQVSTETLTSSGIVISGQDISGTSEGFSVSNLIADQSGELYAVYQTFNFSANLKAFDYHNNTVATTSILQEDSFAFGDLAIGKDGYLYLINRDSSTPSIKQISLLDGQTLQNFTTELPMQSIAILP